MAETMSYAELKAEMAAQQEIKGGYLVPEYVLCASPGLRARWWRAVAQLCWWIRWYGTYWRCLQRGTHSVRHPIWAEVDRLS